MEERLPAMPLNARLLAGQLEDAMSTWRERRMGETRQEFRRAAITSMTLTTQLVVEFQMFYASLQNELAAYDEAARKGQG